jgi:hypothetical protein
MPYINQQHVRSLELNKILKTSFLFRVIFKWLILLYPLIQTAIWLDVTSVLPGYWTIPSVPSQIDLNRLSLTVRMYGCLVDMIPTAIIMLSFYYLYKLFQLYAKGVIFTKQNISYIQKIGFTILLEVFASILVEPLLTFVLTSQDPPSERLVSISFSSANFSYLLIGGIIILISWIMNEAKRLEDESTLTI